MAVDRVPPLLFRPTKPLEIKAALVIELHALFFQQALLEDIAAIAGEGVGHLTFRIDNAMPRNVAGRVKVLEHVADQASASW